MADTPESWTVEREAQSLWEWGWQKPVARISSTGLDNASSSTLWNCCWQSCHCQWRSLSDDTTWEAETLRIITLLLRSTSPLSTSASLTLSVLSCHVTFISSVSPTNHVSHTNLVTPATLQALSFLDLFPALQHWIGNSLVNSVSDKSFLSSLPHRVFIEHHLHTFLNQHFHL